MSSPVLDHETLLFGRLLHYAGLAIVLVVGAATFHWFYRPLEAELLSAEMQIDALAVAQQNAPAIRREHARLSRLFQEIEARYTALEERVPIEAEAGSFLKHVSEIADEEKLAISSFQPAQSVEGDGYTALEVMLDGRGSYQSICSFFDRLAKMQRLSKVKDLSIGIDPESDNYPMKATIVIYYGLKPRTAAAAREVTRG